MRNVYLGCTNALSRFVIGTNSPLTKSCAWASIGASRACLGVSDVTQSEQWLLHRPILISFKVIHSTGCILPQHNKLTWNHDAPQTCSINSAITSAPKTNWTDVVRLPIRKRCRRPPHFARDTSRTASISRTDNQQAP